MLAWYYRQGNKNGYVVQRSSIWNNKSFPLLLLTYFMNFMTETFADIYEKEYINHCLAFHNTLPHKENSKIYQYWLTEL